MKFGKRKSNKIDHKIIMNPIKLSLLLLLFSQYIYAQKNWPALEVGAAGAEYEISAHSKKISKMNGVTMDSVDTESQYIIKKRIVDSTENKLIAEYEFMNIITGELNYKENILGKHLFPRNGYVTIVKDLT